MDKAKMRLFAGAGGTLFGFAGLASLGVSLTIVLSSAVGLALAVTIIAVVFLAIACLCFYLFLLPNKSTEAELDQLEHAGAEALADLPIDTLKYFVTRHPIASAGLAAVVGYALLHDSKETTNTLHRLVQRFL
ncbi:hypothetical protein [Parvularcula sp. LCG005]|uniref:hypothetical protein n=1 Tax=Parvularcula sp. LCG005 TaxID=3078805 RepID=UPI002942F932|nr:hypothetical protein [Parvularcula sp. LCG005]WOI52913.1 hypothetical protein RUI03_12220 [Parvularcula sp. LCG005]